MSQSRPSKLIVVAAFDQDDDGELVAAYGPAEQRGARYPPREIARGEALGRDRLVTGGEPRYRRVRPANNPFSARGSAGDGMMPNRKRITIDLPPDVSDALDRMVADMRAGSREQAAATAVHDWLISAGYLRHDGVKEDTPTEGEA